MFCLHCDRGVCKVVSNQRERRRLKIVNMAQPGLRKQLHMNPYDYHKYLINEYVLKRPGDTRYG